MRDYFKRLKEHPGKDFGLTMPIFGALAGASNESFPEIWQGALFGCIFAIVIIWPIILISNIKK